MRLFHFFKKEPAFIDPFFGALRFLDFKSGSCFEGRKTFAPTGVTLDVLIDADKEGPHPAQRDFFSEVERNFDLLKTRMTPLIEEEFRNWKEDFIIREFDKEFSLVHLHIPRQDARPHQWELAFTSIHDPDHHITIEFEGLDPQGILIDG
ncbi:MAG: hypothetical protein EOP50_05735 [Sphingobacteriales bacterium]|nr:MAG: hypothetical protein EOP50_05735 [Sphingobacteriales bacterium]